MRLEPSRRQLASAKVTCAEHGKTKQGIKLVTVDPAPSETNVLSLVERLRSHEMPQAEVRGHFELVREWVRSLGYPAGPPEMPPIRVYVGLRRRDWLFLLPKLSQFMKQMGWDMDEAQKIEHGEARAWQQIPAVIFGGPPGLMILVRKGFGPRHIQHEMLHIFENYLGLKPGALEKRNLDLWARERNKT